jgi:hypothetical protein
VSAPRAWSIITPPGWHRLRLGAHRRRDVASLVARRFEGVPPDTAGPYARALERVLTAQADEAASTGATDLYLLAERVADVPVTASFTVAPLSLGLDAEQLSATDWRDVLEEGGEVADLGGIGAVRTVGRTGVAREVVLRALGPAPEGADDPGPEEAVPDAAVAGDVESVRVDYLVPVPGGSGDALLLVFGTPSGPLAPALVEVFDALATTLRFHDAVPARVAT